MTTSTSAAQTELVWRVLGLLNLYRLLVPTVLFSLYFLAADRTGIGLIHPQLFLNATALYFALAILSILALKSRWPAPDLQAWLHLTCDVVAVSSLLYASGGIGSGLGMLLVVPVGAVSLILRHHRAFMVAALAALALLAQQTAAYLQGTASVNDYAIAGGLGLILFVITFSARPIAERLRESEELVRQKDIDLANLAELSQYIVQNLRESILVVDSDDRIRLINESAEKILSQLDRYTAAAGRARSESAGGALVQERGLDDREMTGALLGEVAPRLLYFLETWRQSPHAPLPSPATFVSADGARVIQPHFARLGDVHPGPVIIFLEDTSLLAERVQQSKLAALGRLSASIAHEIRNPVGAMSHAGQLLAEAPNLSPQEQRLTEIIQTNAARVSTIINNVLQLSRRDATHPERLTLLDWLQDFCAEFCETCQIPASLLALAPAGSDVEIRVDPSHLHQVVWNLCDNALKHGKSLAPPSEADPQRSLFSAPVPSPVELNCGRMGGSGRPFLEVADRGSGIDPLLADKIFEPFFTGSDGGTGLGLFLARELCQSNGALLLHEARFGGGSIFRVIFADPQRWEHDEGMI